MFKSTCPIPSLSPEAEKEILERAPDATLIIVLDSSGNFIPINIGEGEARFIDRTTAEEIARKSTYAKLPQTLTISHGIGSYWYLADDGHGNLVWKYRP
jgi:hypothetical protein